MKMKRMIEFDLEDRDEIMMGIYGIDPDIRSYQDFIISKISGQK